jgi:hypothetical protein
MGTTLKTTIHLLDLEGGQNRDDFGLHCLASLINDDQIEMPSSQADVYKSENSQKSAHLKQQLQNVCDCCFKCADFAIVASNVLMILTF